MDVGCSLARRRVIWSALSVLGALSADAVAAEQPRAAKAAGVEPPLDRAALRTPRALHAVMLGMARVGGRMVAVGERGTVLLSDDSGVSWRQAEVPVSVTLTDVRFADALNGWAVGHAGVVLRTQDGGQRWKRQLDGRQLAALIRQDPSASTAVLQRQIEQLAADGPDKPLLGLLVRSTSELIVVGAYGLALRSTDGGERWDSLMGRIDNVKGLHLNAIAGRGETLLVAGEQGLLRISNDGGLRFNALTSPYNGSLFTAQLLPGGVQLVGGLRGRVFVAGGLGDQFTALDVGATSTINASLQLADGRVVFGSQTGALHFIRPGGSLTLGSTMSTGNPPAPLLAALVEAPDGTLIAAAANGPVRLEATRAR